MIALADDNGRQGGHSVSGARQRWRAVAVVAADARQGSWAGVDALMGTRPGVYQGVIPTRVNGR